MICKYSSHSVGCLFAFLIVSFNVWKFLIMKKSNNQLFFFFFFAYTFSVTSMMSLSNQMSWTFSPMIPSDCYSFRSYIYVFDSLGVDFCMWFKVRVQFHAFACGHPVFPLLFVEKTSLFLLNGFGMFS